MNGWSAVWVWCAVLAASGMSGCILAEGCFGAGDDPGFNAGLSQSRGVGTQESSLRWGRSATFAQVDLLLAQVDPGEVVPNDLYVLFDSATGDPIALESELESIPEGDGSCAHDRTEFSLAGIRCYGKGGKG